MRRTLSALVLLGACKAAVDFSQGRPYTCDDDSQCGSGWRCGLNQQCHAIGAPGTYACRRDAGDCEASWVCGVDNFCIDPDDAGFNACLSDLDCFHGLRCNTDGRCIDPSADLLGPTDSPPGPLTLLGPLLATQGVTASQVAWAIEPRTGDPTLDAFRGWSVAVGTQNLVTAVTNISHGDDVVRTLDAGAWSSVRQVAASNASVFWTTDTDLYVMATNGNPAYSTPTVVHSGTGAPLGPGWDLRTTSLSGPAGNRFGAIALASDGGSEFHLVSGPGGGPSRFGPGASRSELLGYDPCLIASASDGLWAELALDGGWSKLSLPELNDGESCDAGLSLPLRVRGALPNLLAIAQDTNPPDPTVRDGNYPVTQSFVSLYDVSALLTSASAPACTAQPGTALTCHDPRVQRLLGSCSACAFVNESLLDFFPLVLGDSYAVQTDCVVGSNVHTYEVTQALDGTCNITRFVSNEPQFGSLLDPPFGGTNPFGLAKAGQHGELWAGDNLIDARPLFLDRPPGGLFKPLSRDGGPVPVRMFADEWLAEVTPQGLAVMDLRNSTPVAASVAGLGGGVMYADRRLAQLHDTLASVFATVNATDETFLPPYGARAVPRNDGKVEFIVRSFDTVYSGHEPDPPVAAFSVKLQLVPSAGSPITALVAWPARDPDAGQLEGYALTTAGLFAIAQDLRDAWSAAPIATPTGIRVAVFAENKTGRLGYDDGTVYALPSRVLLAPGMPGVHFTSFMEACTEAWGLSDHGLWRLAPDDGGTGHWVSTPLDAADPYNFSPQALSGGRVFTGAGQIYVFNAYGGGVSFVPQAGCGGAADAGM